VNCAVYPSSARGSRFTSDTCCAVEPIRIVRAGDPIGFGGPWSTVSPGGTAG